jgi:hypothetical protein
MLHVGTMTQSTFFALKHAFMNTTETRSPSTPPVKAFRRRQSWGLHRRSIDITDAQLDALEVRGYLDPDRRGDRADEGDVIEMFLGDSLTKRSGHSQIPG